MQSSGGTPSNSVTSNTLSFTVESTPTITSITPSTLEAGSVDVPVTIAGAGFGLNVPSLDITPPGITYRIASNSATQIVALFTTPTPGSFDIGVVSNGSFTDGYLQKPPTQRTSPRRSINVNCGTRPTVSITTRPVSISSAGNDPPYSGTLTAAGSPNGGQYRWTTDNSAMISFDNPTAPTVNMTVRQAGKTKITVTYTNLCGTVAEDSLTFVLSDDITVVAWIDGSPIDLPNGASNVITSALMGGDTGQCHLAVAGWAFAGFNQLSWAALPVDTDVDRRFANAFIYT